MFFLIVSSTLTIWERTQVIIAPCHLTKESQKIFQLKRPYGESE